LVSNITTPFRFFIFKGGRNIYFVTDVPAPLSLRLKIGGKERIWVEQRGAGEVGNVRGALATISRNEKFINMTMAVPWTSH
jgi:hypothetical protein